ncbi:MAG: hypothetical protein PUI85_04500 [Eubacteriales bacterium]|nr:hypothetical protein [Eubacteriales bacterium]MDY3332409.1 hypothetical protein [Gallibacter sp.]
MPAKAVRIKANYVAVIYPEAPVKNKVLVIKVINELGKYVKDIHLQLKPSTDAEVTELNITNNEGKTELDVELVTGGGYLVQINNEEYDIDGNTIIEISNGIIKAIIKNGVREDYTGEVLIKLKKKTVTQPKPKKYSVTIVNGHKEKDEYANKLKKGHYDLVAVFKNGNGEPISVATSFDVLEENNKTNDDKLANNSDKKPENKSDNITEKSDKDISKDVMKKTLNKKSGEIASKNIAKKSPRNINTEDTVNVGLFVIAAILSIMVITILRRREN